MFDENVYNEFVNICQDLEKYMNKGFVDWVCFDQISL